MVSASRVAAAVSSGGVPDEDVHPAVRAMLDSVWADMCSAEEAEARLQLPDLLAPPSVAGALGYSPAVPHGHTVMWSVWVLGSTVYVPREN